MSGNRANMIAGGYRGRANGQDRGESMAAAVDRIRNQRLADLRAVRELALAEEIDQARANLEAARAKMAALQTALAALEAEFARVIAR